MLAGAGEQQDERQLAHRFMRPLLKGNDQVKFVKYNNSIGPVNSTHELDWGLGLHTAVDEGERRLHTAVAETARIPWLVGYSLGAYVVSEFLEHMAQGHYPHLQIAGAILIASPRAYTRVNREGIAGPHEAYPKIPVAEVCNYHDLICSTPRNSILTKLPNIVSALTGDVLRGAELHRWFMETILEMTNPPTLEDIRMLSGYANHTFHEKDYLAKPEFRRQVARVVG